MDTEML